MAETTPPVTPSQAFRFCPRCGRGPAERPEAHVLSCPACGFHFHFNPVVAAGVLVEDGHGRVLFVRRAKEPARGLLAFPGGFVDFGEAAEAAARREAREETGLEVSDLAFLGSWPNLYEW
ncbi:MAG TPA: NUDIX domain-containing protein, partial [Vicinamibacteria bacterium]